MTGLWILLPVTLLAWIFREVPPVPPDHPDRPQRIHAVNVTGREFVWHFAYGDEEKSNSEPPGTDPGDGSVREEVQATPGLLSLPARTPVHFRITSDDYVYVFEIPGYCREIAVPGLIHDVHFVTPAAGEIALPSDPLCSFRPLHDDLMGRLIITGDREDP